MLTYPAKLTQTATKGLYTASCRDFPQISASADSADDALLQCATDIIMTIASRIEQQQPIPTASAAHLGEYCIHIPLMIAIRTWMHNNKLPLASQPDASVSSITPADAIPAPDALLPQDVQKLAREIRLLQRHIGITITPAS